MKLMCLHRQMGDWIDGSDGQAMRIGEDIPPVTIWTIDVRYPSRLQKEHDEIYYSLVEGLKRGGGGNSDARNTEPTSPEESHGKIDFRVLRRLCHVAFSPRLDRFVRGVKNKHSLAPVIQKYVARDDLGFALFYAKTKKDSSVVVPMNRFAQAVYLATDCPRLRYLASILDQEGLFNLDQKKQAPRFLIFCHWPMVMWVTEMFLDALGVEHLAIRSSMSPEQRTIAANKFTSRDSRCDVLITTFNCGATGLNLHENCSRVIVLEPALNINTLLQSVGRVAKRLGQTEPQKVWILFQDHTICRYLEANSTKKALPQIAAELHGTIREFVGEATGDTVKDSGANEQNDDNESAATDVDEGEGENASGARRNKRAEERIIDRTCAEHIQNLLGQRMSRLGMDDVKDLGPVWDSDSSADRHGKRHRDSEGDSYAPGRKRQKGNGDEGPATEETHDDSQLPAAGGDTSGGAGDGPQKA